MSEGLCGAQVPGISPLRHGGAAAPQTPPSAVFFLPTCTTLLVQTFSRGLKPGVDFCTAAAAVYLSRPTGYVDLPGGVTLLSILLLFLTGGCAVGLLCCLVSQCRAYGGVLSRGKSHTGHVL